MPLITAEQLNTQLDSTLWPMFSSVEAMDESVYLKFYVPNDLSYFAGHFPDQAVLPGVVQVHWAGELAKMLFGAHGFSELKGVKFNGMILPDQSVGLALSFRADRATLRFEYLGTKSDESSFAEKLSSGSMVFIGGNA